MTPDEIWAAYLRREAEIGPERGGEIVADLVRETGMKREAVSQIILDRTMFRG